MAMLDGDAALWPSSADDRSDPMEHWCSGASGVGSFLLRLAVATDQARALELTERAAVAVWRRRWYAGPVACHGLAGNGGARLWLPEPRMPSASALG